LAAYHFFLDLLNGVFMLGAGGALRWWWRQRWRIVMQFLNVIEELPPRLIQFTLKGRKLALVARKAVLDKAFVL